MRRFADEALDRGGGRAPLLETERHVLIHGHVRIERIALEDHGDVAVSRFGVGHIDAADEQPTGGRALQPGRQAQERGLAAAGRADQDDRFAVLKVDRHVADGDGSVGEGLADPVERE